jgi:hypothetical protein
MDTTTIEWPGWDARCRVNKVWCCVRVTSDAVGMKKGRCLWDAEFLRADGTKWARTIIADVNAPAPWVEGEFYALDHKECRPVNTA